MAIVYTPQGRTDARNFPRRVYFSCHEADHSLLEEVAQQLRQIIEDCVVAYREPDAPVAQDHFEEVEDFPLVVIPVTDSWFREGLQQQEFALLKKQNKPMIPILFDDTLADAFNTHSDDMQFLRLSDPEYPEKLRRALQGMLVDRETVEKVEKVFTHKLFIAYCREDLEQVRQLIRCIHQVEAGRQISVWFDKYLQAGRNFEEVIFSELDESQLFGMVLTPHLVQRDTYVKRQEYPRALTGGKRMIVFQLADADWQTLRTELEAIAREHGTALPAHQQPVPVGRDDAFAAYVKKLLREVDGSGTVEEKRERDYLLGLAYRNGIGVEFDYRYAMKKFKAAADEGEYRAAHCLAEMFYNGIGMRRDLKQAKKWYIREIEYLFEEYQKCVALIKLTPMPIFELENGLRMDTRREFADKAKKDILLMAGKLVGQACLNARILRDNGYWNEAEALYRMAQKALEWSENNANQVGVTKEYGGDLENELNQFLMLRGKWDLQACRRAWEQALADWRADSQESCFTAVKGGHNYAVALMREGQAKKAVQVMEQALVLIRDTREALPQRTREIQLQLYRDIGRSYLIQRARDTAERKENADKALVMLEKERQLLTEYPFDIEENPDLLCKTPWNSFCKAQAYAYAGSYDLAFSHYLAALEEGAKVQFQMGELSTQRDLPLTFLQLYAEIAQRLGSYRNLPESFITLFRKILAKFEAQHYNGEHQFQAQLYFEKLRAALQAWETCE